MAMEEEQISFPLDADRFFRRACPLCKREFKVQIQPEELGGLVDQQVSSFLLVGKPDRAEGENAEAPEPQRWCPYCGQTSGQSEWWTEEQLAYIMTVARDMTARLVNDSLIRPMNRKLRGTRGGLIRFEGKEVPQQEARMRPELEDMTRYPLPCCNREMKVEDGWTGTVHCFFCGFPHAATG